MHIIINVTIKSLPFCPTNNISFIKPQLARCIKAPIIDLVIVTLGEKFHCAILSATKHCSKCTMHNIKVNISKSSLFAADFRIMKDTVLQLRITFVRSHKYFCYKKNTLIIIILN